MPFTVRLIPLRRSLALFLAGLWLWFGGFGALCLWGLKTQYEASYKAYRTAQVLESKNVTLLSGVPTEGEFWHNGKLYDAFCNENGQTLAYRDYAEEVAVVLFGAKAFWPEGHHGWDWTKLIDFLEAHKAILPDFLPESTPLIAKTKACFFAFNQKRKGIKLRPPAPIPITP
jgi:hypothetical protein